jgi:hypothetical protein
MELELLTWLVRRWLARPWIVLAWALLVAFTALAPRLSSISIRTEPISYQVVMSEAMVLWGLIGGLSTLRALAEIESFVDALSERRGWRVRGFVAFVLLWLPGIPICALGTLLMQREGGAEPWLGSMAVLSQWSLIAWFAARVPWAAVRSFVFVALAWWIPALTNCWPLGPPGWVQQFEVDSVGSKFGFDSALWQSWFGSMLTLAFATLALDLVHRPHHEVRHPR